MAKSSATDIRQIRKYAGQVQRLASTLSEDGEFARRLIDAVHSGSSAEIERTFTELDVDSDVRISMVDAAEPGATDWAASGPATPKKKARAAAKTRTKIITVTIGIGPISISVTVKKDSK